MDDEKINDEELNENSAPEETTVDQKTLTRLLGELATATANLGLVKASDIAKTAKETATELKSKASTSGFIGELTNYLQSELAPRIHTNGSMMEIYGIGVLIIGKDGIGKSETALELIKKGHIMIADDLTQLYQSEPGIIVCEATKQRKSLMEIKDLGMINVEQIFGIGAVRNHKNLQLVVELVEKVNHQKDYITFFDTTLPKIEIEVEAGRNIGTLIETAALNYRLHLMGQDAKKEYEQRLRNTILKEG